MKQLVNMSWMVVVVLAGCSTEFRNSAPAPEYPEVSDASDEVPSAVTELSEPRKYVELNPFLTLNLRGIDQDSLEVSELTFFTIVVDLTFTAERSVAKGIMNQIPGQRLKYESRFTSAKDYIGPRLKPFEYRTVNDPVVYEYSYTYPHTLIDGAHDSSYITLAIDEIEDSDKVRIFLFSTFE
ncbi:MAG: hypothetical protein AAF911_01795 [Planctomycetota bacterium]